MAKKTCRNCIYMQLEYGDCVCVNADSEYVADFVDLNHFCDEHTSRKKEGDE